MISFYVIIKINAAAKKKKKKKRTFTPVLSFSTSSLSFDLKVNSQFEKPF